MTFKIWVKVFLESKLKIYYFKFYIVLDGQEPYQRIGIMVTRLFFVNP